MNFPRSIARQSRLPVRARGGRAVGRRPIEALEARRLLSITTSFVEVPISAAALAADPALANFRTFDLQVNVTAGDAFNVAGFEARLSAGSFYLAPGGTPTTNPALWPVQPNLEFATFVCVQNFAAPPLSVLPYVGQVATTTILTPTRFVPAWGTHGAAPVGQTGFTVARLTITRDAAGTVYGEAFSLQQINNPHPFVASLPVGARAVGAARGTVRVVQGSPADITIFSDENDNGMPDPGEPSWQSVDNSSAWTLVLPAGPSRIRADVPPGYAVELPISGVHDVTLADGQTVRDLLFQLAPEGQSVIAGRITLQDTLFGQPTANMPNIPVLLDANNNGVADPGERQTTTNADGEYQFTRLGAGTYYVRQLPPATFGPVSGSSLQIVTFTSAAATARADFVNMRVDISVIRGNVTVTDWLNVTRPLANWVVYVDRNDNGRLDQDDFAAETDSAGRYQFILAPGQHRLRQVLQAGHEVVAPAAGFYTVDLQGGVPAVRDFALRLPPPPAARISGVVRQPAHHVAVGAPVALANWTAYLDFDRDGTLDANEPRTTTAADGSFAFTLNPAQTESYLVRVIRKTGWRRMSYTPDGFDVALSPGQELTLPAAEHTQRIMLAGVVFNDLNGNGTKDTGERGVNGRRIWVDLDLDGRVTEGEPVIWPAPVGMFGFEDLVAGTYTVRAEEITGWRNVGGGAATFTLGSGGVRVNIQFGQQKIVAPLALRSEYQAGDDQDPLPPIEPTGPATPGDLT